MVGLCTQRLDRLWFGGQVKSNKQGKCQCQIWINENDLIIFYSQLYEFFVKILPSHDCSAFSIMQLQHTFMYTKLTLIRLKLDSRTVFYEIMMTIEECVRYNVEAINVTFSDLHTCTFRRYNTSQVRSFIHRRQELVYARYEAGPYDASLIDNAQWFSRRCSSNLNLIKTTIGGLKKTTANDCKTIRNCFSLQKDTRLSSSLRFC